MTLETVLEQLFGANAGKAREFAQEHIANVSLDVLVARRDLLRGLGLSDYKIASRADLLGRDPETIKRNYKSLQALGLTNDKIASRADLLGRDPETITRNYEALLAVLRLDTIQVYAFLLGLRPQTVMESAEFLGRVGLDVNEHAILCGTTVKNKRGKLQYFFRAVFDEDVDENVLEVRARAFFDRHNTRAIVQSALFRGKAYVDKNKDRLRSKYTA